MQRSFDDLGTPLHEVTFCVLDLETTGGTAADGGITEIGAVKVRGGECLGTFQTFVNPGCPIPRQITVLTGITEAMVAPAPRLEAVLPALARVPRRRRDRRPQRPLRPRLPQRRARARRPAPPRQPRGRHAARWPAAWCATRCPTAGSAPWPTASASTTGPRHRALDDALATGDLLHLLLERAGGVRRAAGSTTCSACPPWAATPQAAKLRLTDHAARAARASTCSATRGGRALYVGKATNLRARVRSYFSGDDRRKIGQLLRETERIDHVVCPSPLEAAVLEVRLIHRARAPVQPPVQARGARYVYLKLTDERFPRLSVVRGRPAPTARLYLGPLPSTTAPPGGWPRPSRPPCRSGAARPRPAARVRTGPVRRGPARRGPLPVRRPGLGRGDYAGSSHRASAGLHHDPALLLGPLEARMHALAAAERFEEAADVRDRAAALAAALRRQRRFDALRRAGRVVVEVDGRSGAELRHGRLVRAWTIRTHAARPRSPCPSTWTRPHPTLRAAPGDAPRRARRCPRRWPTS